MQDKPHGNLTSFELNTVCFRGFPLFALIFSQFKSSPHVHENPTNIHELWHDKGASLTATLLHPPSLLLVNVPFFFFLSWVVHFPNIFNIQNNDELWHHKVASLLPPLHLAPVAAYSWIHEHLFEHLWALTPQLFFPFLPFCPPHRQPTDAFPLKLFCPATSTFWAAN